MRRGTQGHVAKSHGPVRVPTWHGGDVSIFLFTHISMVIVHISIEYFRFKLTSIIGSHYIPDTSSCFFSVWDYVPSIILISSYVA